MPNTDGIVVDACRGVQITNCTIRTADDGIVLKTSARSDGRRPGSCGDITAQDCTIESHSCALKIGTESYADFHDIRFERIKIEASNRAIGVFSRDGGAVRNVVFRQIDLDCSETPSGFWGSV
jgi:polygalacturonase